MITAENIVNHELIGLDASIVDSTNSQIIGMSGKIFDETKSMFKVYTLNVIKMIPKEQSIWKFNLNGEFVIVNGTSVSKRSYDRLGVKA